MRADDGKPLESLIAEVHALLFAAAQPLDAERLAALTEAEPADVRRAVGRIRDHYQGQASLGGIGLQELAGGWQLTTLPGVGEAVAGLARGRPGPLSPAALETLAVIAYRQPATRADVEAVRGVKADGVIATLLERDMIRTAGRKTAPGRPVIYRTTEGFLRYFGLRSLADLPQPEPADPETG